MASADKVNIQK